MTTTGGHKRGVPAASFRATTGSLSYALASPAVAERLLRYAFPIEEPIDALFVTLCEIGVLRGAVAADATVLTRHPAAYDVWHALTRTNVKQFLPDWSCVPVFGCIAVAVVLWWSAARSARKRLK